MAKIRKTFTLGKQEIDRDNRLVQPNAYRFGQNITVTRSESSDVGSIQSVSGNISRTIQQELIDVTNVTIGHVVDSLNDRIYWFFVGSQYEGIYEFDLNTNTTNRILVFRKSRRILKFSPEFLITGANVIGNLLYWTDNDNPPRKINIDRFRGTAIDPEVDADGVPLVNLDTNIITNNSDVTISSAFSGDLISVAKRPPLFPPIIINPHSDNPYGTPGTELYDNFISFSYRWKYRDGETTAMAPFTQPAFFPENFAYSRESGVFSSMVNRFESAEVKFDVGSSEVTEIEILLKESNNGNVYVLTSINKEELGYDDSENSNLVSSTPYQRTYSSVTYDNSKIYRVLPEDELTRIYDAVPIKALAQDFVGNRLVYGNYVENYPLTVDNADGDPVVVDFNVSYDSISRNDTDLSPTRTVKTDRYYELGIVYMDREGRQTPALVPKSEGGDRSNTTYVDFADAPNRNRLQVDLHHRAPYWATHYRFFIKETSEPFYNIAPLNTVKDAMNNLMYLRIPSLEQATTTDERSGISSTLNKVTKDDILILKSFEKENIRNSETTKREFRVTEVSFIDADTNATITEDGVYITIAPLVAGDLDNIPEGDATTVFETKPNTGVLDLYYEYGQTYRCDNGFHTSSTEDLVRVDHPSQVLLEDGSVSNISITLDWFNAFGYSNGIEAMHVLDEFFGRQIEKGARATTIQEEYRERHQSAHLIHSGIYNDDTSLNRLNEFNISNPISFELELVDGSIQKLHQRNTNIIVFQEDKIKNVPINKNLVTTAGGQSSYSISSQFFNTEQAYSGNYGISKNPESFISYGPNVYFADANRGVICRLGADGITEISSYGLENLFRTDTRVAQVILGGYDEYLKRPFFTLRNTPVVSDEIAPVDLLISSSGCPDPRAECQREVSTINFQGVYLNIANTAGRPLDELLSSDIETGDVVFVDSERTTHFNGNFRWFRLQEGESTNRVMQISPDGIITSIVDSCSVTYPVQANHVAFNISSEAFNNEYDACSNGTVDSVAFLGCPLNADGLPGDSCGLTSNSEPESGFIIYEGKNDLIPSTRTGWYLITEDQGLSAIEIGSQIVNGVINHGVVLQKIDCEDIARGRRRIVGSNPKTIIPEENEFDRNIRFFEANLNAADWYWNGLKDTPQIGDTLYSNNFDDTLAPAGDYYVFQGGNYVLLDASSIVVAVGSLFALQCTTDVSSITQSPINQYEFTYNGIPNVEGTGVVPLRGATIEWVVLGANRYPSFGTYIYEDIFLGVGDSFVLQPPVTIEESSDNITVAITKICYRDTSTSASVLPVYLTSNSNTSLSTLCGSTAGQTVYHNQETDVYHTAFATADDNIFDGGDNLWGVAETSNGVVVRAIRISSGGLVTSADTVYCDFRFPHTLAYSPDSTDVEEACTAVTQLYYGDMADFSSTDTLPTTTLILADGNRTQAPPGIYSNRSVARQLNNAVLGDNEAVTCAAFTHDAITATYATTNAFDACGFDGAGLSRTIYTNNDTISAETTGIYQDNLLTAVAATGFYEVNNFVGFWNAEDATFDFEDACPIVPTFVFADAGISNVQVSRTGVITYSQTGLGTIASVTANFGSVTEDTPRAVTFVVNVPAGYYTNPGSTVTQTFNVTQPGLSFLYSDATVGGNITVGVEAEEGSAEVFVTATFNGVDLNPSWSPLAYNAVEFPINRTVAVSFTAPAGYNNSGDEITGVVSLQQPGYGIVAIPFVYEDHANVDFNVATSGLVSLTANVDIDEAQTTYIDGQSLGLSYGTTTPYTNTVFVVVPNEPSEWTNANDTVSGEEMAVQPATPLPTFSFNDATLGTISIDADGNITASASYGGNSLSVSTNPSSFQPVTADTSRSIGIIITVPATNTAGIAFSNANGTVSSTVTRNQPSSVVTPTFGFKDAGVSASVNELGEWVITTSVNGLSADTAAADPGPLDPGLDPVTHTITVTVTGTVPAGYTNSGTLSTPLSGVVMVVQTPKDAEEFVFSGWNGSVNINRQTGAVTATQGNAGAAPMVDPTSFPTHTTEAGVSRMVSVTVQVPNGFSNTGGDVTGTRTAIQDAQVTLTSSVTSITHANTYLNNSQTVTITVTGGADDWSVQSVSSGISPYYAVDKLNATTLRITRNSTSAPEDGAVGVITLVSTTFSTVLEAINITIEEALDEFTLTASPTSVSLGSDGLPGPGEVISVVTGPTAGRWGFSASDSWIEAAMNSQNELVVGADAFNQDGMRAGRITLTHSDDSTLTETINVRQTGGGAI